MLDLWTLLTVQELDEEAKRILEGLEQVKLEKGGKKAGIGKFAHASLDKNKKLGMFKSENSGKQDYDWHILALLCKQRVW